MLDLSTPQTLKPIQNPRRSEMTAWFLSLCLILILIFSTEGGFFKVGGIILCTFFLISAVIISLGNWQNRKTVLRLSRDQIWYFNGIKESSLSWEEIQRVEVYSGRFNDKISLVSDSGIIRFDIVNLEHFDQDKTPNYGFKEGVKILNSILDQTDFNEKKQNRLGYYYYQKG